MQQHNTNQSEKISIDISARDQEEWWLLWCFRKQEERRKGSEWGGGGRVGGWEHNNCLAKERKPNQVLLYFSFWACKSVLLNKPEPRIWARSQCPHSRSHRLWHVFLISPQGLRAVPLWNRKVLEGSPVDFLSPLCTVSTEMLKDFAWGNYPQGDVRHHPKNPQYTKGAGEKFIWSWHQYFLFT